MNELSSQPASADAAGKKPVGLAHVFLAFLTMGATSFGGVVPYLRDGLVVRQKWLDDKEFVELLSISQSLPGLDATNMAVLVGQRLAGWPGSVVAVVGMCLPGGLLMFVAGLVYRAYGDQSLTTAALKGVAAASVGLVLATVVQLGKKSLGGWFDFAIVALTVVAVNFLHFSVLTALIVLGFAAVLWHRPKRGAAS